LYERFYQLKENPFRLTPDPEFLCMTAQHQEALSGLVYTVCTRPGLTVLVGDAGTGKTTLLYALLQVLEKRRIATAICTNPMLTQPELYDLLMIQFGVSCDSTLKSRQLAALEEKLRRGHADGRPALLIIDEAQRLSPELLEEVRLLLNLETPRDKLVEIILAGQPELLEILRRHEMRQLKQRVSCICKLKPLSREEVREYLFHRLGRAGLPDQALFSEACIDQIQRYTRGIPRLVNTLCDSSLQVGFGLRSPQVTTAIIEEAARDLELIPDAETIAPPAIQSAEPERRAVVAEPTSRPVAVAVTQAGPAAVPPEDEKPAKAKTIARLVMQGGGADLRVVAAEPTSPPVTVAVARNGSAAAPPENQKPAGVVRELRIPLQDYTERQKTVGFLASLLSRWK
jgi:general secretion pathway protein A